MRLGGTYAPRRSQFPSLSYQPEDRGLSLPPRRPSGGLRARLLGFQPSKGRFIRCILPKLQRGRHTHQARSARLRAPSRPGQRRHRLQVIQPARNRASARISCCRHSCAPVAGRGNGLRQPCAGASGAATDEAARGCLGGSTFSGSVLAVQAARKRAGTTMILSFSI